MMLLVQLLMLGSIQISFATKPPGYVEKPKEIDPNPPKYDFGYTIDYSSGNKQGRLEQRDGEFTQGHYYVDLPKESAAQEVQYLADDWGFHPLVKYSSKSDHSSSSTRLALGEEAIKKLGSNAPLRKSEFGIESTFVNLKNPGQELNYKPTPQPQAVLPTVLVEQQNPSLEISPENSATQDVFGARLFSTEAPIFDQNNIVLLAENPSEISRNDRVPVYSKLVASTQDLVSNEDLLKINNAAESSVSDDSSRAKAAEEPFTSAITLNKSFGKVSNPKFRKPAGAGIVEIETAFEDGENGGGFTNPIVVADLNNEHETYTTTPIESYTTTPTESSEYQNAIISTTDASAELKPVNQKLLAPLTAILRLENANKDTSAVSDVVKHVEDEVIDQENLENLNKLNNEYEIQQSQPPISGPGDQSNSLLQSFGQKLRINHTSFSSQEQPEEPSNYVNNPPTQIHQVYNIFLPKDGNGNNYGSVNVAGNSGHLLESQHQNSPNALEYTQHPESSNIKFNSGPAQTFIHVTTTAAPNIGHHEIVNLNEGEKVQNTVDTNFKQNIGQNVAYTSTIQHHSGNSQHPSPAQNQFYTYVQQPVLLSYTQPSAISQDIGHNFQQPVPLNHLPFKYYSTHITNNQKATNYISGDSKYAYNTNNHYQQVYPVTGPAEYKQILYPVTQQNVADKNIPEKIVEKVVEKPVPVPQYIDRPYPVEKPVPYPIEIEKVVVEKIPYAVEKPVAVPIHIENKIPVPYPVETKIPYPVKYEKIVEKPVEVIKYVNKPYPVEVRVPTPVPYPVHVHHTHPVDRIVEKKVPYPVHVEKIVEKKVPVEVKVPYAVEKIVEKVVEKPVPYAVQVEKIVEKKVPYPVKVEVPYQTQTYPTLSASYQVPIFSVKYSKKQEGNSLHVSNKNQWSQPWPSYTINQNQYSYQPVSTKYPLIADSYYRKPATSYGQPSIKTQVITFSNRNNNNNNAGKTPDKYVGPVPLKEAFSTWTFNEFPYLYGNLKFKRSEREPKGLRIEYGFKPPLVPSIEIDLYGRPIKRDVL